MDTLGGSDGESGDDAARKELEQRRREDGVAGDAAGDAQEDAKDPEKKSGEAGSGSGSSSSGSDSEEGGKVLKKKKVAALRKKKLAKGAAGKKKAASKKNKTDGASSSSSGSSSSGSSSSGSSSSGSSSSSDDSSDEEGGKKKKKTLSKSKGKALKKPGGKRIQKKGKLVKGGKTLTKRKRGDGDDNFIDNADDNMAAVRDYNRQKEHTSDEEDPYKDDERMDEDDDDDDNNNKAGADAKKDGEEEEEDGTFKSVLKKMAKRRNKNRKKSGGGGGEDTGSEDPALVKEIETLIFHMNRAYYEDRDARARLKPAVNKLKFLDEIEVKLRPTDARATFVQRGGLPVLRQWLEPNKVDQSLPAQALRTRVIELLPTLPIDEPDLRESGIGKIINYLRQHPKEIQSNKRILTMLMEQWSRAIFHRTMDHHLDRANVDEQEEESKTRARSPSPSRAPATEAAGGGKRGVGGSAVARRGLADLAHASREERLRRAVEAEKARREQGGSSRARVPQAVNTEFKVRPHDSMHLSAADKKLYSKPSDKRIEMEKALAKRRRLSKKTL